MPGHMQVAFRVDASDTIGSGHFMRCLSLADALSKRGTEICFVYRFLPGHLRQKLTDRGFECFELATPANAEPDNQGNNDPPHARWLGVSQHKDVADTLAALAARCFDWLVVDHYGIDHRWETAVRAIARWILVVDDLADRLHDCDALVDQNLYAQMDQRYMGKTPAHCKFFLGPRYAFLREEFHQQRALLTPRSGNVNRILVYFGGVDADNHTLVAINALLDAGVADRQVDVVIGAQHPDRKNIQDICTNHGFACHVQSNEMAKLMADADLAIGAGGISTFERLYLSLPAILRPIATNQVEQLEVLAASGLCQLYDSPGELQSKLKLAFEKGLDAPADCVADGNQALTEYMISQVARQTASK